MNNNRWMRILSAILCAVLLLGGVPSWAEFDEDVGGEAIVTEIPEPDSSETSPAEPEPTELPAPEEDQPSTDDAPASDDVLPPENDASAPDDALTEDPTAAPQGDALSEAVSQWISTMNSQSISDDYEKALWLYDQLIVNLTPGASDDALTALTEFSASPLGYANAYTALMRAAGFEIQTVVGNNTAWNVVKLGGAWTHVDVWADDAPDSFGIHFGLTDAAMARDHAWDTSAVPACTDTRFNYFVRGRGYRAFTNQSDLIALLTSAAEDRAEKLFLYNAGAISSVEEAVGELLPAISADATAVVSEQGCYAAVWLEYAPASTPPVVATLDAAESDAVAIALTPTGIVPKASSLTISAGETASLLGWTMLPAGATTASVEYVSADTKVATVDPDGTVYAKKAGKTTITIAVSSTVSCTVAITVQAAPTSISFVCERSVLGVGESMQMGYKLNTGATCGVTFSVPKDQNVATIDDDGLITALNPGKVTVTVKAYNGVKKTGTLTVKSAPSSITIKSAPSALGYGQTDALTAAVSDGAGKLYYRVASHNSNDESVPSNASISPDGKITAGNKSGIVDLVVYTMTDPAVEARVPLEICPAPERFTLPDASIVLGVKETYTIEPIIDKGTAAGFTYKASNKNVSVSASGTVNGLKVGTSTVTVTMHTGESLTLSVTVKAAPTSVKITYDRATLGVGETMQLGYTLSTGAVGKVTFSIPKSQWGVATVTEDGFITANGVGKATITAITYNGKKKTGTLTVKKAPSSITIKSAPSALGYGQTGAISAAVSDGAGKLYYRVAAHNSNDKSVPDNASVSTAGKITAGNKSGTVDLVVYTMTDPAVEARVPVEILPAPERFELPEMSITLGVKESYIIEPIIPKGTAAGFTYKASNKNVSVSSSGTVKGLKAGTSKVTVMMHTGESLTLAVTVKKAPTSVKITYDRATLGVGETMQLGYTLSKGAVGKVTFSIPKSQWGVATITEDGLITAHSKGKATVTAITYNGKKKSGTLTVKDAPTSVTITSAPSILGVDETGTISASLSTGSAGKLYYRLAASEADAKDASRDGDADHPMPGNATISAKGVVKGVEPGEVWMVVYTMTDPAVRAYAKLNVVPAPETFLLAGKTSLSLKIGVGETFSIPSIIEIDEGSHASYTYSSNKTSYAKVSSAGMITGVKAGSATITVKTHKAQKATITVSVKKKATSIKATPTSLTLSKGETAKLSVAYTPSDSYGIPTFESADPSIATVDANTGEVNVVANEGTTTIIASIYGGKTTSKVTVNAAPAPEKIELTLPSEIAVDQTIIPTYTITPENSHTTLEYDIVSGGTGDAEIENGKIVAKKEGTVTVKVTTHVPGVEATQTITVRPVPDGVKLAEGNAIVVDINDFNESNPPAQFQLTPQLDPVNSATTLTYTIATKGYFTIDENNLIHPITRGTSKVTLKTHNGKSFAFTVQIVDRYFPESLSFAETPPTYLDSDKGETYQPKLTCFPEDAVLDMQWTSSNDKVASVDAKTGFITALSYGRATITGTSRRNPKLSVKIPIITTTDLRCLEMPMHRTTNAGDIVTALKQIDAVQASTYRELDDLVSNGSITSSERTTRQGYIDRAFSHYRFAWTPDAKEYYWKAANSEDGQKDFKVGTYYFGMPYTQTSRVNTPSSVVSNGYFKDSGKGYYIMQTGKFTQRKYPGSDCSSFVSMAIWGTGSSRKGDNTTKIASASYYTTLSSSYAKDMRPGDILVKGGSHVVMFLYYVNVDRTEFVVIEQGGGGSDLYSNCISTSIRNVTYYSSRGYKLRRVSTLATNLVK